jgi:hypothetical protein
MVMPPIYVLVHPTETDVPTFNMQLFLDNPDKKIIHIGGWLRNIFSFYQLSLEPSFLSDTVKTVQPKKKCYDLGRIRDILKRAKTETQPTEYKIRKVALKGKYMENYYPCDNFGEKLSKALTTLDGPFDKESKFCSQTTIQNNWIKHMIEYLDGLTQKIEIMSAVDNKTYDDLLTNNLVFLNLVDGSAVNTLIECAVRNTPVFVNRHPAAVEILGRKYPLYYDNLNDINRILSDPANLIKANEYMKTIDKTPYKINEFVKSLNKIIKLCPR